MAESQRAQTWDDLVNILRTYEGRCVWGCRGEAKQYPHCTPSIDRYTKQYIHDWEKRLLVEMIVMERFAGHAPPHLDVYELDYLQGLASLMLMRHFGAPTRLLDWTDSLWVAAYFAVADHPGEEARIRFFDKYQLEDNVHKNFHDQTSTYDEPVDAQFKYLNKIPKLFHAQTVTSDSWKDWLVCTYAQGPKFPRLIAQQSFFTIASKPFRDHWELVKQMIALNRFGEGHGEIVIEGTAKPEILQGLASMGITAATLYPGLDGIGMSLCAFAQHSHLDIGVDNWLGRDWRSEPGKPRTYCEDR